MKRQAEYNQEFNLEIEYTYDPGEKMIRYYKDGSGSPGCPPSIEIESILIDICGTMVDITEQVDGDLLEKIQDHCLEEAQEDGE